MRRGQCAPIFYFIWTNHSEHHRFSHLFAIVVSFWCHYRFKILKYCIYLLISGTRSVKNHHQWDDHPWPLHKSFHNTAANTHYRIRKSVVLSGNKDKHRQNIQSKSVDWKIGEFVFHSIKMWGLRRCITSKSEWIRDCCHTTKSPLTRFVAGEKMILLR